MAGAQWGFDIYSVYTPPRVVDNAESPQNTDIGPGDFSSFDCSNSSGSSAVSPSHSNLLDDPMGEGMAGREHTAIATKAVLRDCAATGCTVQGLRVEGSLIDARAIGCEFSRNLKGGVLALNGSHLAAEDCTTSHNNDAGANTYLTC